MRYVFKIVVMAHSPEFANDYIATAFQEAGEQKETYHKWYKEVNALDDVCDLELDVLTDTISADYDEMIVTVDGIIYLMNPLNIEEYELFEMNLSIINSVKRHIPLILIFYNQAEILPFITNEFLESFWFEYPELEAFINLTPNQFHQALECLSLAMISGDTPLDIENAWMRFPIFIELANKYFNEQNYYYSAQAMKKVATISEIYDNNEFYIYSEQAAFLFTKVNLYLEASEIISKFDKKKSINFRELYHKAMIKEGNVLFNKDNYEQAALQYESAAQWATIELDDENLVNTSFKLSINSWISACKSEKGFRILERLPHDEKLSTLKELSGKIIDAAKFLTSQGDLENAKNQLYYSIYIYQQEGLFEILKKFTNKLIDILVIILKDKIKEKDSNAAKGVYDEIENLWDAYELEKRDIDNILEKLIKILLEELNFGLATVLMNKINSLELKKTLTDFSTKIDEKTKTLKKREIEEYLEQGVELLKEFVEYEQDIIAEINTQKIKESKKYIKKNDFWGAAKIIKNQAIFLQNIGKEVIGDQILKKSLDILIEGKLFEKFFKFHSDLTEEVKKTYLIRIYPIFYEKLKELKEIKDYEKKEKIFEQSNKKFRNSELYNESKEISKLFIKEIKKEAFRIINVEDNIPGIEKTIELIKKINNILSAYFEKDKDIIKINLDKIYKKIAEIYITAEEFSSARAITDKIENKTFKDELHRKFARLEAVKAATKTKMAEDTLKAEILKERLSFIKKIGKDAQHDRERELKQRRGLKRGYFQKSLEFLKEQDYDKAVLSYTETIIRLNKIKKYNFAGVSLVMAALLLLKKDRINEMLSLIQEIKEKLAGPGKLFSETFSVILLDYIVDLEKFHDEDKQKEALSYIEYLPLFEEELNVLFEYLGKEIEAKEEIEKTELDASQIATFRSEINKIAKDIKKEQKNVARRKMMKKDYWNKALEELNNNNLKEASLIYFNIISKLVEKRFLKQGLIGLILGTLIQINEENVQHAKLNFEKNVEKFWNKQEIETFPEFKIMKYVFLAFENNSDELIELTLNKIAEKLILFEPEINLIRLFAGEEVFEEKSKEEVSAEESEEITKLRLELDHIISNLKQQMGDIKSESKDFFRKRKAMQKRYYDETLALLNNKSFEEVAQKYFELSNTLLKKKDYRTCSLLLLLHGLSLMKVRESPEQLKNKINKFLKSAGLNEKVLRDTFYIMLLLFIIDIKINNINNYNQDIKDLLNILPLFEEEQNLIGIIE